MLHVILFLALGALTGLLSGHLMSGHAFGWIGDLVLGLLGGLLGGLVFQAVFGTMRFAGVGEGLAAVLMAAVLVSLLHLARPGSITSRVGDR